MKPRVRHDISIILGLITVAILGTLNQSDLYSPEPDPVMWGILTALIVLTSSFGIPLAGGEVSMTPLIALTGTLVIGVIPSAWTVICGELFYGFARFIWPDKTGWPRDQRGLPLIGTTAANITMHGLSVLAAGAVYLEFDGALPAVSFVQKFILIGASAAYIATNYLIASLFLLMRGKPHLIHLWKNIPRLLLYEAIPLIFVSLTAQIFIFQGFYQFILFAVSLMIIAFVLRDQATSHKVLQRRVQELDSLQAVGQVLSSSLDIPTISEAIYTEVARLMPATNFYVALYNAENDEVVFPVVYENNQRKTWPPRATSPGLTEYVIDSRQPLLIEKNVKSTVQSLGVEHRGQEALSWLGVPILAGEKVLGMIAVQSYPQAGQIPQTFDQSHLEILSTIAAQASVAIQNAQLYTQTDQSLALRVQELSSILSTIQEGIMLLDPSLTVVEVNRAFANFVDEPLSIFHNLQLAGSCFEARLGFQDGELIEILSNLRTGDTSYHRAIFEIQQDPAKIFERIISPVMGDQGAISGWLIALRDLTEEVHLTQLREDLTRMLVHDLRSPMVTIQGGLDLIEMMINSDENKQDLLEMVANSRRGGEKMLGMINELLSIHKYESGQLVLNLEPVSLPELLTEVSQGFLSILEQLNLTISTQFDPALPTVWLDRDLIQRLIHNLMDNAVKFTPDGGQIEIWAKPDPKNQKSILFGVKDTGIGILPEIQVKLFQKYFSSGDQKSRRKGTGIGLYFSKLTVQAHGGSIWAESEPGKGSNFFIKLPLEPKSSTGLD